MDFHAASHAVSAFATSRSASAKRSPGGAGVTGEKAWRACQIADVMSGAWAAQE